MSLLILMVTQSLAALRAFFQGNGLVILPELELLLFAIGILVMDFWVREKHKYWNPALALAGTTFSAMTLWMLRARIIQNGELSGFSQAIEDDSYFIFFAALLLVGTALVILLSTNSSAISHSPQSRYYALLLFATMALMPVLASSDLLVIFISLEISALSLYFLAATPLVSGRSSAAAVKFLFSSATGSALLLYGITVLYGLSASTNLLQIASAVGRRYNVARVITISHQPGAHGAQMYQLLQSRLPEAANWHPSLLQTLPIAALALILVGILIKIASVPFHRTFSGVPIAVTLYSTGLFAVMMFALLLRLSPLFLEARNIVPYIVTALATATLACSILSSLRQRNLEGILVYSSTGQLGFLLLGLNSTHESALTVIAYYLLTYLFILTGAFAILTTLRHNDSQVHELRDLAGLRRRNPVAALLLIIFVMALAGFPPTAGFFARYFIFRSLLESGHRYLAWFAAFSAVPLAWSCLRIAYHAWRGADNQSPSAHSTFGIPESIVLGICLFVSIAAGLYSEPFMRAARYAFGQ